MIDSAHIAAAWRSIVGSSISLGATQGSIAIVVAENGQSYVLKRETELAGLGPTADRLTPRIEVLRHLAAHSVPVAVPLRTDAGDYYLVSAGEVYTLSPYVAADHEPPELRDRPSVICSNIGTAIARLHAGLASYSRGVPSWEMDLPTRVAEALDVVRGEFPEIDEQLGHRLDALVSGPLQLIHGDCHLGNILLWQHDVAAFVDLDHLPRGPRGYDLSYFLGNRSVWVARGPAARQQPFLDSVADYLTGYDRINPLTAAEKARIVPGMLGVQVIMTAWHISHENPDACDAELDGLHWIIRNYDQLESLTG